MERSVRATVPLPRGIDARHQGALHEPTITGKRHELGIQEAMVAQGITDMQLELPKQSSTSTGRARLCLG
jgi:hypothetical protein